MDPPIGDIAFWSVCTYSLPVVEKIGGEEVIGEIKIASLSLCKPATDKQGFFFSRHFILTSISLRCLHLLSIKKQ